MILVVKSETLILDKLLTERGTTKLKPAAYEAAVLKARDALQLALDRATDRGPAYAPFIAKGFFVIAQCEWSMKDPKRLPAVAAAFDAAATLNFPFDIQSLWQRAVIVKSQHGESPSYFTMLDKIMKLKPLNPDQIRIMALCEKVLTDKKTKEVEAAAVAAKDAMAATAAAAAAKKKAAKEAKVLAEAAAAAAALKGVEGEGKTGEGAAVVGTCDDLREIDSAAAGVISSANATAATTAAEDAIISATDSKYITDVRWQRFDIGRLLAQQHLWKAQQNNVSGVIVAPIPCIISRTWWAAWCAHVGGFSASPTDDGGDLKTWLSIASDSSNSSSSSSSSGKGESLGSMNSPDLEVVTRAFAASGLSAALPSTSLPFTGGEGGATSAPGPVRTKLFLIDGDNVKDTLACTDDAYIVNEEIYLALTTWYGADGQMVPEPLFFPLSSTSSTSSLEIGGLNDSVAKTTTAPITKTSSLPAGTKSTTTPVSSSTAAALAAASASSVSLIKKSAPVVTKACCMCGLRSPTVELCANCKTTNYCDKECQRLDWEKHKPVCKKIKAGGDVPPDSNKDRRNGLVGLNNIGNTCYMGSALQALSAVWPLSRYYVRNEYEADKNPANKLGTGGAMSDAYAEMLRGLWYGSSRSFEPRKMLAQAAAFQDVFSGLAQQDAQELLNFVIDGLHEDCNKTAGGVKKELRDQLPGESDLEYGRFSWAWHRSINDSRIVDLFGGQFKSTLTCPSCSARSVHFDYFNMVQLPMPDVTFKDVSIVLRRMQPGLWLPEASILPTIDAAEKVKKAWDDIAAHAEPLMERYVVRVNTRGGRAVPVDEILEELAKQSGLPVSKLFLHTTFASAIKQATVSDVSDFLPCGSFSTNVLNFSKYPFDVSTSPTEQSDRDSPMVLFATEVFPPDWCSPFSPPADVASASLSCELEAEAVQVNARLGHKEYESELTRAAAKRARHPGRRVLLIARLFEPKIWSERDMPLPTPKLGSSMNLEDERLAFVCLIPTSVDTPLSIVRMHVAAALVPLIKPEAREKFFASSLTPSETGEPVRGHVFIRTLASMLHFGSDGEGRSTLATLATFLPKVSAANTPTVTLGGPGNAELHIFSKGDILFPDVAFSKLHINLRPVMSLLDNVAAKFETAPLDTPSALAAAGAASSPIADIVTSFRQYLSEEGLDDDNKWLCPGCKQHVPARKTLELWKLPEFIIASFKRFKTSTFGQYRARKATQLIDFPLTGLNLSEIDAGSRAAAEDLGTPVPENLYDCLAVVNQLGQLRGGHCE